MELRVHPTLVPQRSLIAGVNDVLNAVMVNADAVGTTLFMVLERVQSPQPLLVIADIVDVARNMDSYPDTWVPALGCKLTALKEQPLLGIEEVETGFYIRFSALISLVFCRM